MQKMTYKIQNNPKEWQPNLFNIHVAMTIQY